MGTLQTYDEVYKKIEKIILEQCDLEDLDISSIEPTHTLNTDLGIDSVDFLNLIFDIESEFEISIPVEEWMNKASENAESGDNNVFQMRSFVEHIIDLIDETVSEV